MDDSKEGGAWETMSLLQPQNIVESGLLIRINGGGSSSPTRSRYATNEAVIAKIIQGYIIDSLRESSDVLSVMQLMFLMLAPKN